jgi:small GTP-binding protein
MSVISKKICFIGDYGVGKTSLIRRFVDRQFSDHYLSTIGVKISRKVLDFSGSNNFSKPSIQLIIWDLEGQTKFHSIAKNYLQGAAGAIVVADVNRQDTIARIKQHIKTAITVNPQGVKILVALNKCDSIASEQVEKLLALYQIPNFSEAIAIYRTSAKSGENVDEIFQKLAYSMTQGAIA